ncbi:MAG: SLBB domain-containing protein [Treponema sp.]|nr:SLBB domain-containing protein [Treponema sp.]
MKKNLKRLSVICALFSIIISQTFATTSDSNFTSTENIKQAQVAMATNEYIVTAGDIYSLVYNGGSFSITVDSTYRVRIANLGIINARGLTIQEFKSKVEALIVNNYPTGGVQFFLSNPAQFHVYVKGEVRAAKTVDTWALAHVSSLLSSFYTDYSSRRFVKIISADGTEKRYDLYKASRYGDFFQDPYLRPGDTIIVEKVDRKIWLSGAVMKEGEYELEPGEELRELIFDYGDGFNPYANKDKITLSRFVGGQTMYVTSSLKESDLHGTTPLACYDRIYVASLKDTASVIYVEGAVSKYYDYENGDLIKIDADDDGLADAVELPGAITSGPAASARLVIPYSKDMSCRGLLTANPLMILNSSDLKNACIIRTKIEDNGKITEEKIYIDLDSVMHPTENTKDSEDILLQPNDRLVIPYIQYFVTVTGGVSSPGHYAYQPDRTWAYYVNLAMGFDYDQSLFKIVKITDKNGKKISKKDVIPPEAVIYASRNSPNSGWLIPLLTSIFSFITAGLTLYGLIFSTVKPSGE